MIRLYKLMNSLFIFLLSSSFLPFLLSFFPVCEVSSGVQNKRKGICDLCGVKKVV